MARESIYALNTSDSGAQEVLYRVTVSPVGNKVPLDVSSTSAFSPPQDADYISRAVNSAVETYVFKRGGAAGTTLKTVVVTYTDSTLDSLLNVSVS